MTHRFVFDTNVIVSGLLLPRSTARQAFDRARDNGAILLSAPIIDELNDVLHRKKFDKYLTQEERLAFLAELTTQVLIVKIEVIVTVCRDPKDNKFLELALSGAANCIISGDDDLLELHPFREIPILNPTHFLQQEWDAQD